MQAKYYLIKDQSKDQIIESIEEDFSIKKESASTAKQDYYDTFDLRLKKHGLILYKAKSVYNLEQIVKEKNERPLTFTSPKEIKFWQDFPTPKLQKKLKSILYVRALIMLASLNKKIENYSILDESEKIVARIALESMSVNHSAFPGIVLTLTPVKGYDEHYDNLKKLFIATSYSQLTYNDLMILIIKEGNTVPTSYSTKLAVIDDPEMSSGKAINKLLISLMNIVKQNETGVIKNIDAEFLHDFRVAFRKTRSILSLLKSVFNQEIIAQYRSEIESLAKSTNKLRDYDVYLLNKGYYQSVLPKHLLKGLDHFFANINQKQKYEHRKLTRRLNSASYHQFFDSWKKQFNDNLELFNSTISKTPIIELACKNIYRRFKKVLKDGKKITKESPDADLHRLRIDCKKLRYLIEFFSGLFPREEVTILITQLKKLQTCLGEFNDYSVQQIHFEEYLSTIPLTKPSSIETAATIGALISISNQEKQNRRNAFFKIFKKFIKKKNLALYKNLFKHL